MSRAGLEWAKADEETMRKTLGFLHSQYGGVKRYLTVIGFDEYWQNKMRTALTAPPSEPELVRVARISQSLERAVTLLPDGDHPGSEERNAKAKTEKKPLLEVLGEQATEEEEKKEGNEVMAEALCMENASTSSALTSGPAESPTIFPAAVSLARETDLVADTPRDAADLDLALSSERMSNANPSSPTQVPTGASSSSSSTTTTTTSSSSSSSSSPTLSFLSPSPSYPPSPVSVPATAASAEPPSAFTPAMDHFPSSALQGIATDQAMVQGNSGEMAASVSAGVATFDLNYGKSDHNELLGHSAIGAGVEIPVIDAMYRAQQGDSPRVGVGEEREEIGIEISHQEDGDESEMFESVCDSQT